MFEKIGKLLRKPGLKPLWYALYAAGITYGFHLLYRHFAAEISAIPVIHAITQWLMEVVFSQSLWINRHILGLQVTTSDPLTMHFINNGIVWISAGCSGLKLFMQVTVLFLLFPGPWRQKLWFIPLGWLLMHITNVFRIVTLSLMAIHLPQYWDFAHDWILRPLFYLVIFAMWVWWVERKVKRKKGKD